MGTIHLHDGRRLHILNHTERKAYHSWVKRLPEHLRRLTMIDLTKAVEAYDADGTLIKNKDQKLPDLKEIVLFALRAAHQGDQNQGAKEKLERYTLIRRIDGASEIEFTQSEIKMILDRVSKIYLQVEIVGCVHEILAPKPVAVA